jgi:muramoyltetrapeptide carboxypeptidase
MNIDQLIIPPPLRPGDGIAIAAPARKISYEEIKDVIQVIEHFGYQYIEAKNLFESYHQFSATDAIRAASLNDLIHNQQVKAIVFARGGYGCLRIADTIDYDYLRLNPKWLCGFSDITVFINHLVTKNVVSLHCDMAMQIGQNPIQKFTVINNFLTHNFPVYRFEKHPLNRNGNCHGKLVGGNLSVLYSLLDSDSFPDLSGKILFLEDLDEYLYHIDRMLQALKRSGKLKNLAGLVVGGMTEMKDNTVPFGQSADEIIFDNVSAYGYPLVFGLPAGHIKNNHPLLMNYPLSIIEDKDGMELRFL